MYAGELAQMKKASIQEDWNLFQQSLESLLCSMSHETLVTLLLIYVKQFINEYLQVNARTGGEFNVLSQIETGQLSAESIDNLLTIFDCHKGEPGVNEFRKAVLKFRDLLGLEHCTKTYKDTFISSITNLLIAIPSQSWGTENPDLWHRWLQGTKKEDSLILAKYYHLDGKRVERSRRLLEELTTRIADNVNMNL